MELPVEIIELILGHASYQDLCRARRISRNWHVAAADLLRRGTYKRKTLEERVQFILFKLQKEVKKSGKKDKILKEDLNKMLTYALDATKLLNLSVSRHPEEQSPAALTQLFLYADDEIGLWEYLDEVIAKSDKIHLRSPLFAAYAKQLSPELYELNLDLIDEAIDFHFNLNIEVDPTKGGSPENAENLIKVFKHYFDALIIALKKMNKPMLGWLQHIHKKFNDTRPIKSIIGLNFITTSIFIESYKRHAKKSKKTKIDFPTRTRRYILLMKIFAPALLSNTAKEDFMRGLDAYTSQVAVQFNDVIKELMAVEVDPDALFHSVNISLRDILDTLSIVKDFYNNSQKNK